MMNTALLLVFALMIYAAYYSLKVNLKAKPIAQSWIDQYFTQIKNQDYELASKMSCIHPDALASAYLLKTKESGYLQRWKLIKVTPFTESGLDATKYSIALELIFDKRKVIIHLILKPDKNDKDWKLEKSLTLHYDILSEEVW